MTIKERTLTQEIAWRLAGVYAAQTHGNYVEETLFDRGGDWAADEVGRVLSERLGVPIEALDELIVAGQSARVLIGEIARLQALLKVHQDTLARLHQDGTLALLDRIEALETMLLRLYQDTVVPSTGYCHRCGCQGFHEETCAMAEVEELLGIEEEGGATDDR